MKKIAMKEHHFPGKLIVFEGVDGSGKTTLVHKAMKYLSSRGISCCYVKMPSDRVRNLDFFQKFDNSTDSKTRDVVDLVNLTVFVSGDRLLTLDTEIIPALKCGKYVLCDRYCFTGFVRCNDKIIHKLSERFPLPDLSILASASPKTLRQRVKSRENEKNNFYDEESVNEQIERFNSLAKKQTFHVINTDEAQENIDNSLFALLSIIAK